MVNAAEQEINQPTLKVLLCIPHVFAPEEGSLYSSQCAEKRELKQAALHKATIDNLNRHGKRFWIHASLGNQKPVITRELSWDAGIDLRIQIYTPPSASLSAQLAQDERIEICDPYSDNHRLVPLVASRRLLEQACDYDLVGYMEDDLLIEDSDFFQKLHYLHTNTPAEYCLLPHRCEHIPEQGDVILSGDPDGGRPDLFWDTGEKIGIPWPTGMKMFYRATNPHSGCYFLSKDKALSVFNYWKDRNWLSPFQLSGPLEQAGSGLLLPVLKLMKPMPHHYRFLMVRHQDELWKRHAFEKT